MNKVLIKLLFVLFQVLLCLSVFGQKKRTSITHQKKVNHEVKLNLAYTTFGFLDLSYELLLHPIRSSFGSSVGTSIRSEINIDFGVFPFYKLYLTRPERGIYLEAHSAIITNSQNQYFGSGLALGAKFIRNEYIIADITGGVGKILNSTNDEDFFYPRIIVNVGYRM